MRIEFDRQCAAENEIIPANFHIAGLATGEAPAHQGRTEPKPRLQREKPENKMS